MYDVKRREVLAGTVGLASAPVAATATPAAAGDPSFMNNVPDPLLSGKDLPTFKFALEKTTGKVIGGSSGKEATVEQLPISKGIAGVSMRLEPGAMRELHWHATAAEWAFVVSGTPKFLARRVFGAWPIQSVMLKVPNSEKYPLSKIRTKWQGWLPTHCSMWPCPRGKYQTSPGSNSLVSARPCGSMTVVRTRPSMTNAHSAAVACQ